MDFDCSHEIRRLNKTLVPLKESHDKPRQCVKKQRHPFTDKDPSSQSYVFSSRQAWMWELDHKEGWVPKKWCFWIVVLEKTLQSPLDHKETKPVIPKGNQPWIFIGKIVAEAEAPILWPPDGQSQLTGKDPDAGKGWRQKKRVAEDEMVGRITDSMDMNLNKLQEVVKVREAWCATVHRVSRSWTRLSDWTTTMSRLILPPPNCSHFFFQQPFIGHHLGVRHSICVWEYQIERHTPCSQVARHWAISCITFMCVHSLPHEHWGKKSPWSGTCMYFLEEWTWEDE